MSTTSIVYIVLFIIFVLISAYFATAEIAFVSIQRFKLETMIQNNVKEKPPFGGLVKRTPGAAFIYDTSGKQPGQHGSGISGHRPGSGHAG